MINLVGSVVPFHQALAYEENNNLREMGLLPGFSNLVATLSSTYIRKVSQKDFWSAVGNYDPLPYWEQVDVPALVIYGAEDTNTDSHTSAARLDELEKQNIEILIFEGSGHAIEDPKGQGNSYFREDASNQIEKFIFEAVSK